MPYKKYFIYREEISIDGGLSWISTGQERLSGDPIGEYTTREGCESSTQYRWANMDPSVDYYCLGSVKFYKQKKQVSYDGIHWKDITPAEYQKGDIAEQHSADCSTDVKKLVVEYSDGSTREVECGGGYLTSDEVKSLGDYNEMTYAIIGDCTVDIDNACFKGFTKLKYATLSSGQTYIPNNCFSGCTSLQGVYIPSGITSLTSYVFDYCSSLTSIGPKGSGASIEIPSGVTKIGGYTFANCSGLTSVTIPNNVTSIGNGAFQSCDGLTSVTIPDNVQTIGERAFLACSNLESVACLATTPPTLGSDAFTNTNNCPLLVPASSLNAYKSANNWSRYASRIQPLT